MAKQRTAHAYELELRKMIKSILPMVSGIFSEYLMIWFLTMSLYGSVMNEFICFSLCTYTESGTFDMKVAVSVPSISRSSSETSFCAYQMCRRLSDTSCVYSMIVSGSVALLPSS